jgi:hypothetical protein
MKTLVILASFISAVAFANSNRETPAVKPGKVLVCKTTAAKGSKELTVSDNCVSAKGFTHSKSEPASLSERHSRN